MTAPGGAVDRKRDGAVDRRGSFTVEPFTEICWPIWERREHAVLGVSPGNSYFSIPRLAELLGWLRTEFQRVDVVIPDSALEHTYLALGYEPRRASRKMRDEINALRNRVNRAWESSGGPRPDDGLHRMSEVAPNDLYQRRIAECERALAEDRPLWETCMDMSRQVLAAKGSDRVITEDSVERGMQYLIAELPFFLASSELFDVSSSLNFYHEELPLAELLFAGKSVLRPLPGQGYATIRPATEAGPLEVLHAGPRRPR